MSPPREKFFDEASKNVTRFTVNTKFRNIRGSAISLVFFDWYMKNHRHGTT